jgi:hypothetical protein
VERYSLSKDEVLLRPVGKLAASWEIHFSKVEQRGSIDLLKILPVLIHQGKRLLRKLSSEISRLENSREIGRFVGLVMPS